MRNALLSCSRSRASRGLRARASEKPRRPQATQLVRGIAEVRRVVATIGDTGSDASSSEVNKATLAVSLLPRGERARHQSDIEAQIRVLLRQLPATRVSVLGMGNGQTLDITLASDDAAALTKTTQAVLEDLRRIPGTGNVSDSSALHRPEVQVRPDFARMAEQGVTTEAIASVLRVATNGDYSAQMPKFNLAQRQLAVRVTLDEATRSDLDAVGQLRVAGRSGAVPLASVAELSLGGGPAQIGRLDRMRNVTLSIELGRYATGELNTLVQALPPCAACPPACISCRPATPSAWPSCSAASRRRWRSACCASTACSCCCSTTSCSRSPSSRRCRFPPAARSLHSGSRAAGFRCRR